MILAFLLALAGTAFLLFVTLAARSGGKSLAMIEAGTKVKKGYYFAAKAWSLTPVSSDGEVLGGEPGERYLRVPLIAVIVLAPVMGGLFVLSLPVIGVYVTLRAAAGALARVTGHAAKEVAATIVPGVGIGHAYLTGQDAKHANGGDEPPSGTEPPRPAGEDVHLDELEREISARRERDRR
jgi:hypothetical protein